jgi:serine/threonine-protein kinase
MVGQTGQLKIIDLGFGKRVKTSADYDMSIRLNWAATIPQEFSNDTYDFTTEIYFVGKLFESLIVQNDIRDFKFTDVLRVMCSREPHLRIKSFAEVERKLGADRFADSEFSEEAVRSYRAFADSVANALAEVGDSAEYSTDLDKIQTGLSTTLRQVMLEEYVPDSRLILKHLIDGSYRYFPRNKIEVAVLREFVRLLQAVSESEKRIIIGNLHTRLDTVKRFDRNLEDEDIPF